MTSPDFKQFATCTLESADTRAKRIVAFVYFRSKFVDGSAYLFQIKNDYADAGLGTISGDIIRKVLKKDPRVRSVGTDKWMIPADRFHMIETDLDLERCLPATSVRVTTPRATKVKPSDNGTSFVDTRRIKELKKIKNANFDLLRLLAMCNELNDNAPKNHISTILLVRAILDHVPPIFGLGTFKEVANNYPATKSVKASLQHLENSSRTIADAHLHTPIRKKEVLPAKTQVNFSQDLDVLLAEIVRIS